MKTLFTGRLLEQGLPMKKSAEELGREFAPLCGAGWFAFLDYCHSRAFLDAGLIESSFYIGS